MDAGLVSLMAIYSSSTSVLHRSVLKNLFDSFDINDVGKIHINQLPGLLVKIGKDGGVYLHLSLHFQYLFVTIHSLAISVVGEVVKVTEAASRIAEEQQLQINFEEFISILEETESDEANAVSEGPDKKVLEFLRILEEYRLKCEEEGNYLEAGRANKQLAVLKKQEEKRQQKAIVARHIAERQDVQLAHSMQFSEFNSAWDKYMEEYDAMSQMYIQQMTERHAIILLEFQKSIREELASKPPKWSRELLDWRRRQHTMARSKHYAEAQKIRKVADLAEEKERRDMENAQAVVFARREAKFRQQQQSELQALLKRIEARRKEHVKQRDQDSKRLLQRNRNVQAVLESKQAVETQKLFAEIKKQLLHSTFTPLHSQNKNSSSGSKSHTGGAPESYQYEPSSQDV